MPNLTASWEEASVRSLLRGDASTHAGDGTHTGTPCPGENKDRAMAALLHFIMRLKDFVLEKTSSGRKKTVWASSSSPSY